MSQQTVTSDCWTEADALGRGRDRLSSWRPVRRGEAPPHRAAVLTRTVETEVIPRLLLARRAASESRTATRIAVPAPSEADIARLAKLVLAQELPATNRFIESLRERGTQPEAMFLDLLAPTARLLGDMWDQDLCDFSEVTIGLWRLQQVVRDLTPDFLSGLDGRTVGPRALLVPVPGEQHTFGLSMVVEFFRRAGWQVWAGAVGSHPDLAALLHREWFDVVGISVGCGDRLEAVAASVRTVRRASCNRNAGVMVGGQVFNAHPEFAALVGADATAVDGRQAVLQAQSLLTLLSASPSGMEG